MCCRELSKTADTRQKFSLGIFTAHFRHFRVDVEVFGGISLKAARYFTVFWGPPPWTGIRMNLIAILKQKPAEMSPLL